MVGWFQKWRKDIASILFAHSGALSEQKNAAEGDETSGINERLLRMYGTLDREETYRQQQAIRHAMEAERETLNQIKQEHGADNGAVIRAFRDYLAEHPDSGLARSFLIGALRRSGGYDGAIAVCEESLAIQAQQVSSDVPDTNTGFMDRYMIASLLMEKNDLPGAIRHLERLNRDRIAPDYMVAFVYRQLGDAYKKQGDTVKVQWAAKQAAKEDLLESIRTDGHRFQNCELGARLTKLFKARGW